MDILDMAKELGNAIKADERYTDYAKKKLKYETDPETNRLLEEFEKSKAELALYHQSGVSGGDEVKALNEKLRADYAALMQNETVSGFLKAKKELEELTGRVNSIISFCITGEESCGKSCAGCSGCG